MSSRFRKTGRPSAMDSGAFSRGVGRSTAETVIQPPSCRLPRKHGPIETAALAVFDGAHLLRARARDSRRVTCFLPSGYPAAYETFRFLSNAFISLIKMLIVPLIFSTILVGIGKTGDIKAVGRMGVKALIYFEIASTAALAIGLTIAHLVRPGDGLKLPPSGEHLAKPLHARRDAAPPVPLERRRRHGAAGHPAGRRLRHARRHRGGAHRDEGRAVSPLLRLGRLGDVPADRLRHGPDAARRLRRDGGLRLAPRRSRFSPRTRASWRRSTGRSFCSRSSCSCRRS